MYLTEPEFDFMAQLEAAVLVKSVGIGQWVERLFQSMSSVVRSMVSCSQSSNSRWRPQTQNHRPALSQT